MNFGTWLKSTREAKRISGVELERKTGISRQYISNLERGVKTDKKGSPIRPSREKVIALAKALNADENEALKLAGYASDADGLVIVGFGDELDPDDVAKIKSYIAFLKSQKK